MSVHLLSICLAWNAQANDQVLKHAELIVNAIKKWKDVSIDSPYVSFIEVNNATKICFANAICKHLGPPRKIEQVGYIWDLDDETYPFLSELRDAVHEHFLEGSKTVVVISRAITNLAVPDVRLCFYESRMKELRFTPLYLSI